MVTGGNTETKPEPEFFHKTPDIYLAAFLMLNGAALAVSRPVGTVATKVSFELTGGRELRLQLEAYYAGKASCDPLALKHKMGDVKDMAFGTKTE